jgi:hypothetical protein
VLFSDIGTAATDLPDRPAVTMYFSVKEQSGGKA